ncbi:MAG: prolyl oligopeptidase family serine peptidase [Aeoliella sp.]
MAVPSASAVDHSRAHALDKRFRGKIVRDRVKPHWVTSTEFWYVNDLGDGQEEIVLVDAAKGSRTVLADRDQLPDQSVEPWRPATQQEHTPAMHRSPNGKWESVVRDHNLWLRNTESGEEIQKTTNGIPGHGYESKVYWSPDSLKLVAMHTKKKSNREVFLIESSPDDQLQPKLDSYHYLKPGDDITLRRPRLFQVDDVLEIEVSNKLFDKPWSIDEVRWSDDGTKFTFYYNQRGHQVARVLEVAAGAGSVRSLIDERAETFIDYAHKHFAYYLDNTDEIIWMSERDGWNHLYLINATSGEVKNRITRGEWVVRGVNYVDVEKREVWFRASGIDSEQDPYFVHECRIGFDGKGLVRMTRSDGTHKVIFSPEAEFLIDSYSRVDAPPVTELRRTKDGSLVMTLEQATAEALVAAGWRAPGPFVAKARDGETDVHGVIFRPTDFDPNRKYPVVEEIYAGPQGSNVPKRFSAVHFQQRLAELGFIVVVIDGLGTSNRSKAFHDVCWKNLGDAGFPDRILWLQAAAAEYPQLDLTRVGVKGHSAGGQNAMGALLAHGDFYKAAVASCGCHDNRMDKIWWNELWMGWPAGPHYAEQSNVTNAHKLNGELFLIVGELDKNVDPSSTMQVVDALVKAEKDFDLLVVPGCGHNTSTPYVQRRTRDFLIEHLQAEQVRHLDENREASQSL